MRTFHRSYLSNNFKTLAFKNMSITASYQNIPEDLCNLAKQLNVDNIKLSKVINSNPEKFRLYNESRWLTLFEYLRQYNFKSSELLEMVDANPDILNINRNSLHKCMCAWTNFRFDDKKLKQLLVAQPSCLLLDEKSILSRIPTLLAYVGKKHNRLLELISYSPNVMFDKWKYLEPKLDYVLLNMEFGPTQFVTTTVMSSTLFDIKCRHHFLLKLGMYKTRDPKANLNEATGNPSLKKIIETSDKQFAVKVAGVTAEEFFVFKKLFKKQLDDEEKHIDEDDSYANDHHVIED